ncbi:class III lanthionine synthetase LanKC N-terminal domain-containing protein [Tengunoibacter tsumagoiensis]|uniref:non-specific serine/threonine protein kinase n=1 Tax=Tengunoibacter tsumagoiensis TaxID=2014871 RepID=A0A402A178_9CHLR|nr:lanthionine synthetase LanC family protein [Tengunoibacter tsumagoiensis]GCE12809.1 hypothetical protein KTT_26680 [Tengunoibacter tsumagoiensis]
MQVDHRQVESVPPFVKALDLSLDDPLLQVVYDLYQTGDLEDWNVTCPTEQRMWLRFRRPQSTLPAQGWKLHLSADHLSAETVLRRVLPLLLAKTVAFKCTSSLLNLTKLNKGEGGESQIGKFLTIYPRSSEEAVEIAPLLDELTDGLSGPRIPSDRMLRPNSLVFYRYGGMNSEKWVQESNGQIWPALTTPDQRLIRDVRSLTYKAYAEWSDPFLAAGVASELPKSPRIIAQRYLLMSLISASVKHKIYLAVDLEEKHTCIIKALGHSWQQVLPVSEREDFYREACALRVLGSHSQIPTYFDLLEHDSDMYLVMSDVPGELLMQRMSKLTLTGAVPLSQVLTWASEVAELLLFIHEQGFVYADLKPTNLIIGSDEKLSLIDFELADRQGAPGQLLRGTRGYVSPQQYAAYPRHITDDIYSFGALLYFIVTGAESSNAPDPFHLLNRPLELFRADIPDRLKQIIVRCLQPEVAERYASFTEILTDLTLVEQIVPPAPSVPGLLDTVANELRARSIATDLLETLCAFAYQSEAGTEGLTWRSKHFLTNGYALRDLNAGHAGTLLALAGLAAELDRPEARNVLAQGAAYLQTMQPHSNPPLSGLYVGEAGVGTAFLFAGLVLNDSTLLEAAVERGRMIAAFPQTTLDLFHGSAGRLLFHLLLWDTTREQEHLDAAWVCGEHLIQTAQIRENGEVCWEMVGVEQSTEQGAYLGYAHGVAGIADALLDLFEATADTRLLPIIQGATRWLQRLAIPMFEDQSGLSWPMTERSSGPFHPFWCHGATGIGRFFLHVSRYDWAPEALTIAKRAAITVFQLTKHGSPVLCHGLAGSIEFLLDLYQETQEPLYLSQAQLFGRLLEAFATEQEGHLTFFSDRYDVSSPDYQVGYAGIAMSFLRLSAPERIPAQLSRAGFRAYKRQAEATAQLLKR